VWLCTISLYPILLLYSVSVCVCVRTSTERLRAIRQPCCIFFLHLRATNPPFISRFSPTPLRRVTSRTIPNITRIVIDERAVPIRWFSKTVSIGSLRCKLLFRHVTFFKKPNSCSFLLNNAKCNSDSHTAGSLDRHSGLQLPVHILMLPATLQPCRGSASITN
jgi:hypothetical protein